LNWQNKLVDQNLNAPYLVLYNASAKDANATIVVRSELHLEFIVESKGYWYGSDSIEEAYYLTAILNSSVPNLLMKDFQTKGLFGARDVHKKILDIYYPKYNETTRVHKKLAKLSQAAHEKAKQYLIDNQPKQALSAGLLGRLRTAIKRHLKEELEQIDELVKALIS
jgi:hypothetical protein